MRRVSRLQRFINQGFDLTVFNRSTRKYRIRCSQCQYLVINRVPCHEFGCPNQKYECKNCNAIVPRQGRYCQDCAQSAKGETV